MTDFTDFTSENFNLEKFKPSSIDEMIPCLYTFLDGNLNPGYGSIIESNINSFSC